MHLHSVAYWKEDAQTSLEAFRDGKFTPRTVLLYVGTTQEKFFLIWGRDISLGFLFEINCL